MLSGLPERTIFFLDQLCQYICKCFIVDQIDRVCFNTHSIDLNHDWSVRKALVVIIRPYEDLKELCKSEMETLGTLIRNQNSHPILLILLSSHYPFAVRSRWLVLRCHANSWWSRVAIASDIASRGQWVTLRVHQNQSTTHLKNNHSPHHGT